MKNKNKKKKAFLEAENRLLFFSAPTDSEGQGARSEVVDKLASSRKKFIDILNARGEGSIRSKLKDVIDGYGEKDLKEMINI